MVTLLLKTAELQAELNVVEFLVNQIGQLTWTGKREWPIFVIPSLPFLGFPRAEGAGGPGSRIWIITRRAHENSELRSNSINYPVNKFFRVKSCTIL